MDVGLDGMDAQGWKEIETTTMHMMLRVYLDEVLVFAFMVL